MSGIPTRDRRSERRQSTIDEILDAAWSIARAEGLASLSLRELARRVGMRPQSLYTYFASKNAIYDAMYAQGCRDFVEVQRRWVLTGDPRADVAVILRSFVRFCIEDPARHQLLFQRTIPGFEPSAESFAISARSLGEVHAHLATLGIDDPGHLDLFSALGTGLADQQISNDPGGDRWTRLVDDAVAMFIAHVGAQVPPSRTDPEGARR